eukprot:2418698-Prymnesium_polylepis.1
MLMSSVRTRSISSRIWQSGAHQEPIRSPSGAHRDATVGNRAIKPSDAIKQPGCNHGQSGSQAACTRAPSPRAPGEANHEPNRAIRQSGNRTIRPSSLNQQALARRRAP